MVDQDFAADSPIGRALRPKPGGWLPVAACEKLQRWADQEDAAKCAAEAAARRLRELAVERDKLAAEVERVRVAVAQGILVQKGDRGRVVSDGSDRLAQAEGALAELDQDGDLAQRRYGRVGIVSTPVERVRAWLTTARPGDYRAARPVEPKLAPYEDARDAVSRLRGHLAELRADRHRIESAPLPAASAKEAARRAVEAMAERGRPFVDALLEGGAIDWPDARRGEDVMPLVRDTLAWLFPDELTAALDREIAETAGDQSEALEPAEKHETLGRIADETLRIERSEEALIEASQANGVPIARRFDASPLALLGLEAVRG